MDSPVLQHVEGGEGLMGIGDPPVPVASDVEANNPVPRAEIDKQAQIDRRLTVVERSLS